MFWNTFVNLCMEKEKSPTAVGLELGFSRATVSNWKSGGIPRETAIRKIADYFGVTVDYLLGNTDNREKAEEKTPSKILEDEPMSEKEKQMWELWRRVPDEQKPHILALIQSALALKAEEYKNGGQKG